jgi:hypothetical protein
VKFFSAAAAADLKQMTNAVEQAFRNVLQPNKYSSWLQDDEDYRSDVEVEAGTGAINNNQSRQEEMVLLRQVYIPQLVFALHELLFETRDLIKG